MFTLPLAAEGTDFQRRVWELLRGIPYGETRSYGEIASELGSGPRAIGGACGRNPIAIVVPCHRILGSGRAIGGYSGGTGLGTKRFFLALEGATVAGRGAALRQPDATMSGAAGAS